MLILDGGANASPEGVAGRFQGLGGTSVSFGAAGPQRRGLCPPYPLSGTPARGGARARDARPAIRAWPTGNFSAHEYIK